MKEHEDRHAAVVEKHMLVVVNAITMIKHKHIYICVVLVKGMHMNGAIVVVII